MEKSLKYPWILVYLIPNYSFTFRGRHLLFFNIVQFSFLLGYVKNTWIKAKARRFRIGCYWCYQNCLKESGSKVTHKSPLTLEIALGTYNILQTSLTTNEVDPGSIG